MNAKKDEPYEPQPSSLLLSQPFEIRLAIYSHIALAPFECHKESKGLKLVCRQLRHEVQRESLFKFDSFLRKLEQRVGLLYGEPSNVDDHDNVASSSVKIDHYIGSAGHPEIIIKLPFSWPKPEENWRHYEFGNMNDDSILHPHREGERDRWQSRAYIGRVEEILAPIDILFGLDCACIRIHLIHHGSIAEIPCEKGPYSRAEMQNVPPYLGMSPVGALMEVWISKISKDMRMRMANWRTKGESFQCTTTLIEWDFSEHQSADFNTATQRQRHASRKCAGCRLDNVHGTSLKADFTEDGLQGTASLAFNRAQHIRSERRWSKDAIAYNRELQSAPDIYVGDVSETALAIYEHERRLAQLAARVQEFPPAGEDDSEVEEDEARRAACTFCRGFGGG
ncbi:hypothetical protein NX059_002705 [Plenodomus lindquistii]|nr:hypothetical protein NX059_002705 [Plenodomus lindquistii]